MSSASISTILVLLFFMFLTLSSSLTSKGNKNNYKPCKSLAFWFHDIRYNGHNADNATSVLVGAPPWANLTTLANQFYYGDLVVFNDPITLENDLYATPVGRAQGQYFYVTKDTYTAWLAFSFVFNSADYNGTINFVGADPITLKTRDISIVGGTGDFFMHRGIATLMTGTAFEDDTYFSCRADINFYECW